MDHKNIVNDVKIDLTMRGLDLSGPCGAFQITSRVAWKLREEGAGLLEKSGGNNCEGFATDIICYPNGQLYDILIDGGGANGPDWRESDKVESTRWRPPFQVDDEKVDPIDTDPPIKPKPEPEADIFTKIEARLAVIEKKLDRDYVGKIPATNLGWIKIPETTVKLKPE